MGVPAVLGIFSDDHEGAFVTDWASPERVVPALAGWIESCRENHAIPTATNYREFAETDPDGNHFRDDFPPDTAEPDDLQYRYVVRTGAYGSGWIGDLTVWRARERLDREPVLTVWHQIRFSHGDTSSIHALPFHGLLHIIKFVRSLDRPQHTGPALQTWTELATWHRSKAGAA
ncbi:hypothetical protein ACGFIF_44210 [Kribbella sp. NPDC049174]|uniref:hypothetical protein n=1 Tax=Kribbella sp. NPDC049174 TaxID=3364112 RepID=UPI00371A2FE5